jgi:hypothetical protein
MRRTPDLPNLGVPEQPTHGAVFSIMRDDTSVGGLSGTQKSGVVAN